MLVLTSPPQVPDRSTAQLRGRSRSVSAMIPRYVLLLAALLSVLAGTALLALLQGPEGVGSSPPPAARSAAATQSGHSTLPVGAQGPISAVVGADLPAYRVS